MFNLRQGLDNSILIWYVRVMSNNLKFVIMFLAIIAFSNINSNVSYSLAPVSLGEVGSIDSEEAEKLASGVRNKTYIEENLRGTITRESYELFRRITCPDGWTRDVVAKITTTEFGRQRGVLTNVQREFEQEGHVVTSVSVFGAGYDEFHPAVYEPFELGQIFLQAKVFVYDENKNVLEALASKDQPGRYIGVQIRGDTRQFDYISKFGFVPLREGSDGSFTRVTVPETTVERISSRRLNFITQIVPKMRNDLAVCFNTLEYFSGVRGVIGRFFQIQLADSLKPGGKMLISLLGRGDRGIQLSQEEANVLGLVRTVDTSDSPKHVYVYTKIGNGTPLLKELAEKARQIILEMNTVEEERVVGEGV